MSRWRRKKKKKKKPTKKKDNNEMDPIDIAGLRSQWYGSSDDDDEEEEEPITTTPFAYRLLTRSTNRKEKLENDDGEKEWLQLDARRLTRVFIGGTTDTATSRAAGFTYSFCRYSCCDN